MYDLGIGIEPARESPPPIGREGVAHSEIIHLKHQLDSLSLAFSNYKDKVKNQFSRYEQINDSLSHQIEILQNQIFVSPYAQITTPPTMYSEREGLKYLQQGNQAYLKQDYKNAIDLFSKATASPIQRSVIGDAYYWIGDCYIQLGDELLALAYLKKVAEYPNSEKSAEALFLTAITYQKLGNEDMAKTFFKRIIKKHPGIKLAKLASLELKRIDSPD